MAGQDPTPSELAAVEIVAGVLGGSCVSCDGKDEPDGMHDFDVNLPDDRCIALEVTGAIDEATVRLSEAAFGKEGRARSWPAPGLANDWLVVIPPRLVKVNRLMREMLSIVTLFEREGIARVDTTVNPAYRRPAQSTPAEVVEAKLRMFRSGVIEARVLWPRPGPEAQMFIAIRGGGTGTANADQVNQLIVERAAPKRNKLARAAAAERHLFVWLDGTQPDAELAVATLAPPSTAPAVPSEIDVVWLATPPLSYPERLWRVRPPGPWEVLR